MTPSCTGPFPAGARQGSIRLVPTEPYYERLRRLRNERGLSQPELFKRVDGVSIDSIRILERSPDRVARVRYPSAKTLAALAEGLDVPPEEFPEYELARARELLDERVVGLDVALENLRRWQAAQPAQAARALDAGAGPKASTRRRPPATGGAGRTRRGAGGREP